MAELVTKPIVVGVDGSDASLLAVDWAAADALQNDQPLRIVHAFIWPLLRVPIGPIGVGPDGGGLRADAEHIVDAAVQRAKAAAPGIEVTATMPVGAAVPVLLAEAGRAARVVLGTRGLGGFAGLLIGSTAVQLASHATCPVLVTRTGGRAHERGETVDHVVAGVDGSPVSDAVLELAFREAERLSTGVVVVHAVTSGVPANSVDDASSGDTELTSPPSLATSVERVSARYPGVDSRLVLRVGHPGKTLVEAASGARLLVVGTRGLGGFKGLLLGSVSQAALHHAGCSVALVPSSAG